MPDSIRALIMGLIEGLTEFLPVSSTGHMILAMPALGIDPDRPPWHAFLYFIQIGAILAIVVYFWRHLWKQVFHRPAGGPKEHLLVKLFVASIPAAAIGFPLDKWVESHLETPIVVAGALIVGAGLMELIERRYRVEGGSEVSGITLRQAFLIGVAQCVSIIPGTSRAMATILGGLMVGLPASTATEFSFYLAIPTLLGAGLLRVVKHRAEIQSAQAGLLAIGFVCAFLSALAVVHPFMAFVRRKRLRPFGIYRILLGIVVLAWWFTT